MIPGHPDRVRDSATSALQMLGMRPLGAMQTLPSMAGRPHRQTLRTIVMTRHGPEDVAIKVVLEPTDAVAAGFAWEHRVTSSLWTIADGLVREQAIPRNPVMPVLHETPITAGDALISVSRFVSAYGSPLRAHTWGAALGLLHVIGATTGAQELLRSHRATNALSGLTATAFLEALDRPDHPFRNDRELVLEFVQVLKQRTLEAVRLDPEPLLVHRDLHALNCLSTKDDGVAIDWQEAGWGNRSDDFAWLHLFVERCGGDPRTLKAAQRAYARITQNACPSQEQIRASGQVRELLCLGFSLQNAYRSPRHLEECLIELPVLRNQNTATKEWHMLFNPAIFEPGWVL